MHSEYRSTLWNGNIYLFERVQIWYCFIFLYQSINNWFFLSLSLSRFLDAVQNSRNIIFSLFSTWIFIPVLSDKVVTIKVHTHCCHPENRSRWNSLFVVNCYQQVAGINVRSSLTMCSHLLLSAHENLFYFSVSVWAFFFCCWCHKRSKAKLKGILHM